MPPVCTKLYIHPPSLVVIFSYAPSNFPTPLQVIIAQSLKRYKINALFCYNQLGKYKHI